MGIIGQDKTVNQGIKPGHLYANILAFIFKVGVMVAADSQASMGGYICEFAVLFGLFS